MIVTVGVATRLVTVLTLVTVKAGSVNVVTDVFVFVMVDICVIAAGVKVLEMVVDLRLEMVMVVVGRVVIKVMVEMRVVVVR